MKNNYDYKKIGENIKKLRAGKGYTQAVFAEMLEVSTGYLSEIETGRQTPSSKKLFKMMELLECTPNELILGDDQPKIYITNTEGDSIDNLEDTIKTVVDMMKDMSPDEKFKIFTYARDQHYAREYLKIKNKQKS